MQNFTFHPSLIKSHNGEKLAWLDIYQTTTPSHKAVITFYLANNETDSADVLRYKQQVESEILIAIKTHEIDDKCLEIADNVLHCQSHEVETILKMFERMVADYAFIWIDLQYLIEVLKNSKTLHFQQSHATGIDSIMQATKQIFDKVNLPEAKTILTCTVVPSDIGFEEVGKMDELMENALSNVDFYHAINFEDENTLWNKGEKGCWLGVLFLN
ncbi:hypothetical protein AFK20_11590 [Enhydrobacter aerosaccus]|uniref:Uncharacterized protein n=1 Tax=Enhydrobacter aerosaccus TaxID=225324 RepID=A0ABR5IJ94_9HYPH|nr:hypothetical protein [Enhydrobacter aerosaccus]KND18626.1 hypothetical protein AFK20_11590 [Enhydrobacter aerosaccus]